MIAFSRVVFATALLALAAPVQAATFHFIRHAESKANAGTAKPDEIIDPPLTEKGQNQAEALVGRLAGLNLTHIYVSSYQRTSLTIAPTAAARGLTPVVTPAIREWSFGTEPLDGFAGLRAKIGEMFGKWFAGQTSARIEGRPTSESLDELNARVLPAYAQIIDRHKDEDGDIAIIGHGGSIGWVMPSFAKNATFAFALQNSLHNAGIVRVGLNADGAPLVENWDGTAFNAQGPAPVPLPAGGVLLIAGIAGLVGARRGRRG